jgi:glycosyltransferase involved in cell wall biosynthesis
MCDFTRVVIAGVFHFPYGTAPASRIKNLAKGFIANGFLVDVIALCPPPHESRSTEEWEGIDENLRCKYILSRQPQPKAGVEKIRMFFQNFGTGKLLKNIFLDSLSGGDINMLVIYGRHYSILGPILKQAKILDIPVVTDVVEFPKVLSRLSFAINPLHLDHYFGLKYLIRGSNLVTVISKSLASFVSSPDKTYLLPSIQTWSDVAVLRPRNSTGIISLVYVGNLIDRDAPILMFDFVKLLSASCNLKLILVGRFMNNSRGASFIKLVKEDELLSQVTEICGEVDEVEKAEIYKRADAFILPRRNHPDEIAAFPTRIVEFIQANRLVIASPVGDIPDYLSRDEIIYLDEGDIKASVVKAVEALENPDLYNAMISNVTKKATSVFNSDIHAARIAELLINENGYAD